MSIPEFYLSLREPGLIHQGVNFPDYRYVVVSSVDVPVAKLQKVDVVGKKSVIWNYKDPVPFCDQSFELISTQADKFHHEFPFKLIKNAGTDQKMSKHFKLRLGTDSDNLTPDLIWDVGDVTYVLEFTTLRSNDYAKAKKAFDIKRNLYLNSLENYSKLLDGRKIIFYVVVVGSEVCLTNAPLSPIQCQFLSSRFKLAWDIEEFVMKNFNEAWMYTQDEMMDHSRIQQIMVSLAPTSRKPNEYFTPEFSAFCKDQDFDQRRVEDCVKSAMQRSLVRLEMETYNGETITVNSYNTLIEKERADNLARMELRQPRSCRTDFKRVVTVPGCTLKPIEGITRERIIKLKCPNEPIGYMHRVIWKILQQVTYGAVDLRPDNIDDIVFEALFPNVSPKITSTEKFKAKIDLSPEEEIYLALHGVQAKDFDDNATIQEKAKKDKHSFSFEAPVGDIQDFIKDTEYLKPSLEEFVNPHTEKIIKKAMKMAISEKMKCIGDDPNEHEENLISEGVKKTMQKNKIHKHKRYKKMSHGQVEEELKRRAKRRFKTQKKELSAGIKMLKRFKRTPMYHHASLITIMMTELAASVKAGVKHNEFLIKPLRTLDGWLILKPTNSQSHIFFSLVAKKDAITSIGYDTLFPPMNVLGDYVFSNFKSVQTDRIDHLLKAQAMSMVLLIANIRRMKVPFDELKNFDWLSDPVLYQNMLFQWLTFLENKPKTEEIITLSRYAYMESFTLPDHKIHARKILSKLPAVKRSRLQIYYIQRLCSAIDILDSNKLRWEPDNHKCLFDTITGLPLSDINQKIDEFYHGYVGSKTLKSEQNSAVDLADKIITYEQKFLDNPRRKTLHMTEPEKTPTWHEYSPAFIKYLASRGRSHLEKKLGEHWKNQINREIKIALSRISFEVIATLKASARYKGQDNPIMTEAELNHFLDVEKAGRARPRVAKALIDFHEYVEKKGGVSTNSPIEILTHALKYLEDKECIYVDLFKKPQHGGLREIYVIEIAARIVQLFLETIGRVLCSHFESEVMTHPKGKYKIPLEHGHKIRETSKDYLTISQAGDAAKWNQAHFVPKFATMLMQILPEEYHNFVFRGTSLWVNKDIMLPPELIKTFFSSGTSKTSKPMFGMLKSVFFGQESKEYMDKYEVHIKIQSGMMQGILHFISSLLQTLLQLVTKEFIIDTFQNKLRTDVIVSSEESSDDSELYISIPWDGKLHGTAMDIQKRNLFYARLFLRLKEELGLYAGIFPSYEKTTNDLYEVGEFNSEWFFKDRWVRPTFRWEVASLSLSMSECLVERQEEFHNLVSDILEGGGTTYECFLIQYAQAHLHYTLMGQDSNPVYSRYADLLMKLPDPSMGFYIFQPAFACGLAGFKFALYMLCRNDETYSRYVQHWLSNQDEAVHGITTRIGTMIRGMSLHMGNRRLFYNFFSGLHLPKDWRDKLEKDPQILFRDRPENWNEGQIRLGAKFCSPSIVSSISKWQPTYRLMAASIYILNRHVISIGHGWAFEESKKRSILWLLTEGVRQSKKGGFITDFNMKMMFPMIDQYESLINYVEELTNNSTIQRQELSIKARSHITVFDQMREFVHPLLKMVRQKWFGEKLISSSIAFFNMTWLQYKGTFPWLRDTYEDTKTALRAKTVIEVYNMVSRLNVKARQIFLTASSAKRTGENSLYPTMTRIFWPSTKVLPTNSITSHYQEVDRFDYTHPLLCLTRLPLLKNDREFWAAEILKSGNLPTAGMLDERMSTLKIMSKFVSMIYESPMELEQDIANSKYGMIGWFDTVQPLCKTERDYERNLDRTWPMFKTFISGYYGRGVWYGKVGETVVKIYAMDDEVELIVLNTLEHLEELCPMLENLLIDFKWKVPKKGFLVDTIVYTGRKVTEGGDGVEVELNEKMQWNIDSKMSLDKVLFDFKENTLRLLYESQPGRFSTILRFFLRDSDYTTMEVTHPIKDHFIKAWINGKPMDYHKFVKYFSPLFNESFEKKKMSTWYGFDVPNLKIFFERYLKTSDRLTLGLQTLGKKEVDPMEAYWDTYNTFDTYMDQPDEIITSALEDSSLLPGMLLDAVDNNFLNHYKTSTLLASLEGSQGFDFISDPIKDVVTRVFLEHPILDSIISTLFKVDPYLTLQALANREYYLSLIPPVKALFNFLGFTKRNFDLPEANDATLSSELRKYLSDFSESP